MNFFKKNILVVTVATGLLVIGGIVLFLNFSSETSYKTKTFGQSPSQPYVPSFSPSVPPEESGEGWYQGDSATYTIGFPPAWTPRVTTVEGGGEEAVFMPIEIANTSSFPRLDVESIPSNSAINSLEQRIATLNPIHFTRSNTTFHNIPAVMLQGKLPLSDSPQDIIDKTFIFFENKNTQYVITYAYYIDKNASANQKILNTMLTSFHIK